MRFRLLFAIFLFILPAASFAQDTNDAPRPVIENTAAPSHLGGEAPNLAIESDLEPGNVMVAGFNLGATYDNRGLYKAGASPSYSGDTRYSLQPSIGFQRSYSAGEWTLSYTPGVSVSQWNTDDLQYTHNVAGDINWKPNAYVFLHARQDFSLTDNPFETVGRVDLLPGLGGPFGPNYDGVLPQTRRTSLVSSADLTYRVTEHSAVGVTGGFQKYSFDAVDSSLGTLGFINAKIITGSAFFSQQFSSSITAGVQLALTDIYSAGAQNSRTQAPAAMFFAKWNPNPSLNITLYGGPEYARTRGDFVGGAVYQHSWYPTAGGTLLWSKARHAFDLQGQHRIANGGGLMETVMATYAGAGYRERLSRQLLAELRTNWSDQKGIGPFSSGNHFRSLWVGGGPVIDVSRSVALHFEAAYVHQSGNGVVSAQGNHLLAQASLDYHFHKSLGD